MTAKSRRCALCRQPSNTVFDMVNKGLSDAFKSVSVLVVLVDPRCPEVAVARAVTDGSALNFVLHPGEGPCQAKLSFSRLTSGGGYQLRQAELACMVGPDSTACLAVPPNGGAELDLVPFA